MTINTELLTKYIQPLRTFIRRYGPYIYLVLVATVISFLMLRISSLNGYEVNDTDVSSDVKPISINNKLILYYILIVGQLIHNPVPIQDELARSKYSPCHHNDLVVNCFPYEPALAGCNQKVIFGI